MVNANSSYFCLVWAAAILTNFVSVGITSEPIESESALLNLSQDERKIDARLRQIWTLYRESLAAGDFEGAASQWVPFVRARMTKQLAEMGDAARRMPEQWSELILLDLDANEARYAYHKPTSHGDTVYEVEFVRWPDGVWLIEIVR